MAAVTGAAPPIIPVHRVGITLAAMLAMISMIMSSTMVNVAIPDIMGAFGVGQDQAHWISTGFLSAMTAGMLLNASLMTRFGPRNVMIWALAAFSLTAFIGQYAPTFSGVVMARIAQGLCAGVIQPLGLSVVFLAYSPEDRGKAMGWFGMGIVFGPAIGPVFGGFIVDETNWRMVFAAPVPIMFIAAGLAALYVPGRDNTMVRAPFNVLSFSLVIASIMLFLNGITVGQRDGWATDPVFYMLFGSACTMTAFILRELNSPAPLLQLKLFSYPVYAASAVIAFVFGAGMFGSLYIVPVMVQTVQGVTALDAGLILLPGGIVTMLVFPLAGRLAGMRRSFVILALGFVVIAYSCWLLGGTGILTAAWIMAALIAFGRVGLGLVIPALNLTAMGAVPRDLVAYAAGTLNFIRMTGAATGVNVLAIIIDARIARHGEELLTGQTAGNRVTADMLATLGAFLKASGLSAQERSGIAMGYLSDTLTLKANELAFQDGYFALALLFLVGAGTTFLLMRRS